MLTQLDIDLVRDSFSKASQDKDMLSRQFYERFFIVAPQTKMLFSGDLVKQQNMLHSVMSIIVNGLHEPEKLQPYLYMLGENHAKMGVRSRHYVQFFEVFIETILSLRENQKNAKLENAWREAFHIVQTVMQKATQESGLDLDKLRA